jgi:hypothetical protein
MRFDFQSSNQNGQRRTNPLSYLLMIPIGIICSLVGIFMLISNLALIASGGRATGTVVEVTSRVEHRMESTDSNGRITPARDVTIYTPVIGFKTADGKDVTYRSSLTSEYPPTVGSTHALIYDKGNPQHTVDDSPFSLWILPLILIVIGLLALATAFFAIVAMKRAAKAITGAVRNARGETPQATAESLVAATSQLMTPGGFMPNAGSQFGALPVPLAPPLPLNTELMEFVRKSRAAGTKDDSIRQSLVTSGWNAADVERALKS